MMITDEAGHPLAVTDLNGAELRALRVLAGAGLIPPLDEPTAAGQGVLIEPDFTRPPLSRPPLSHPSRGTAARPTTATPTTRAS